MELGQGNSSNQHESLPDDSVLRWKGVESGHEIATTNDNKCDLEYNQFHDIENKAKRHKTGGSYSMPNTSGTAKFCDTGKELFRQIISNDDSFMDGGLEVEQQWSQVSSTTSENLERVSSTVSTIEITPAAEMKQHIAKQFHSVEPLNTECSNSPVDAEKDNILDDSVKESGDSEEERNGKIVQEVEQEDVHVETKDEKVTPKFKVTSFGQASNGTASFGGFASIASKKSGFASFSSVKTVDGFGSNPTTVQDLEQFSAASTSDRSGVCMDKDYKASNGEENERSVYQVRAKLYRFDNEKEWLECGVGPLRILVPGDAPDYSVSARIVMRRETYACGPGTKLLWNSRLASCTSVERQGKKNVRIVCVETQADDQIGSSIYLLRVASEEDSEQLYQEIYCRLSPVK